MKKINLEDLPYRIKQILKDETSFAKSIVTRYKMSNARNKNFVNVLLLNVKEITEYYDFNKIAKQLEVLNFHVMHFVDNDDYVYVVDNNEKRELRIGKVFTVEQFLL